MISVIPTYRLLLVLALLLSGQSILGQTSEPSHLDRMTYEDLLELFNDFDGDTIAQERIARTYLERARGEGDSVKVARGYDRLARIFKPETNIKYADSLIAFTKDWNHITYPALGYILKGYEYGLMNNEKEKYYNFQLGLDYARNNNNVSQMSYLLGAIARLRIKWGSVEKAHMMIEERHHIINSADYLDKLKKSTRKERHRFLDEIKKQQLLDSYKSYFISYISQENFTLAQQYLDSIAKLSAKYEGIQKEEFYWWIKDAEIEMTYYQGNYQGVVLKSDNLIQNDDFKSDSNKYYNTLLFRGLSEYRLGNTIESIKYLNLVQENQQVFGNLHNEYLKMLYQAKFDIYKEQSNPEQQLIYLDKLLEIDSVNAAIFQFLEPKLVYEMDAAKLVEQKEDIIKKLNKTHTIDRAGLLVAGLLLLLVSGLAIFHYRQKVIFKNRFEALMEEKEEPEKEDVLRKEIDISPVIVEDILHRLKKLELSKDYLTTDITLNSLAKQFQTNSSYLSRVLNHHKETSFSKYLNGLRVGHALNELKTNPTYRKYTIEAIALECGYKNSASFSRAFYKITGIYPSYYINELNKREE